MGCVVAYMSNIDTAGTSFPLIASNKSSSLNASHPNVESVLQMFVASKSLSSRVLRATFTYFYGEVFIMG